MTDFEGFRFFTTPWTLGLSLGLIAVAATICFLAWRQSGYATGQGLLELLRLAIVGLVAVLLNQPEWVEEYRPTDKPTIAVLHDASRSMDTRDVVSSGSASGDPRTRRDAIAELATSEFWKPLEERFRIEIAPFSPAPPAEGSDYAEPLATATERFGSLRA